MSLDSIFIEFVHSLCERFGTVLTPIFRLISLCGEKAWLFLLIALILCLRKKTRWIGATIILAIFIGFIVSDYVMKPFFMRMRPYTASNLFQDYWTMAGAYKDDGYSMPSGHTIGITAFFVSLYITSAKKSRKLIKNIGIVSIALMVMSRCYLMHHYFSDCMVGILVGFISAYISKIIIRAIFNLCKRFGDNPFFNFVLNFDVTNLINKND